MNSRQRRKMEAARHNAEHELRMELARVSPIFAYLRHLCETRQQEGIRRRQKTMMSATLAAYGAMGLGGFYGDSDGNVTPHINPHGYTR